MFTLGSIFFDSFKLFRENFRFLGIISVICGIILFIGMSVSVMPLQNHYPQLFKPQANYAVIFQSFSFDIPFFTDIAVFTLVMSIISLAAMLIVLQGIKNIETNEPNKYNCLRIGLNIRAMSDSMTIIGIILAFFIGAILIPFAIVVGATFVTHSPVILMTLLAVYIFLNIFGLMVVWNFSVVAIIAYLVSGKKGMENIKYSWRLTYTDTFRILGYTLLVTILISIVDLAVALLVEVTLAAFNGDPALKNTAITSSAVIESIVSSVMMTFYWVFYMKIYQGLLRKQTA